MRLLERDLGVQLLRRSSHGVEPTEAGSVLFERARAILSQAEETRAAIRACIDAIEICGAEGSIAAEHQLLEKWFRDIKVYDIFEGTGQIQRIVVSKRLLPDLKSF